MASYHTDEMDEFQKRSNEYKPDLKGPAVWPKQPSSALSTEYANADSRFVAKTAMLAKSHSSYRIMKGDGICGWRAIAFGYFEGLLSLKDVNKVAAEIQRFRDLDTLLINTGMQADLFEMFVDATIELLQETQDAISNGVTNEDFLVERFNEDFASKAIITHFRILTRSWMFANPQLYEDYLEMPLPAYLDQVIMPTNAEIDEIGLRALIAGVIEPAGFAVEVLYLDRSLGDEVTVHTISNTPSPIYTIRLLYRPGHYDILYKTEGGATSASESKRRWNFDLQVLVASGCME